MNAWAKVSLVLIAVLLAIGSFTYHRIQQLEVSLSEARTRLELGEVERENERTTKAYEKALSDYLSLRTKYAPLLEKLRN